MLRNIICGIQNVIRWLPVVWQDRQWDYWYLLRIMQFKIQLMKTSAENDWIVEKSDRIAEQMGHAIELLDYFMGNEEYEDAIVYYENKDELWYYMDKFDGWWD